MELVRRAKAGDRAAMTELLGIHATQAYRLALHIVRNQADAEDAAQNAFIKAFTNLDRFDDRRPFAPWLLRIVSRESLNLVRANKTRFAFWERQHREEESEEPVESIVLESAAHRDVVEAVNRLRHKDRLVLSLNYFMGLNEAEIAESMGVRPGTVKWRKHKALGRLRKVVEREFPWLAEVAEVPPEPRRSAR